ncbi:MAG: hypothetical protein ABSB87_06855 [Terriglobales bacterium]|jgi:pimeloyl-ACP methyl ester carboxylesterase
MSSASFNGLSRRFVALLNPEKTLLICVLLATFFVILPSVSRIANPYQIDNGEGVMLDGALRIRQHLPLYPNPFAFPVILNVYGPVSYATTALILPHGAPSFPAGRLLMLTCSIALSSLLTVVLRRITGSWWVGASFGLLLLTLPAFRFWLYLLRADVIGVLFAMTGVAQYLLSKKYWYWSIPFFGLALFCKYSLIAAPVAVFIHLLVNRKIKLAFIFAVGLGTASTLAFILLQAKTGGWFAFHMFSTHPDRYSLGRFSALAALVLASSPVVTGLAAWFAVHDLREKGRSFPPVYLAASSVTALTAGKLGSHTNHFIELMVACCLCAGLGYSLLLTKYAAKAWPITVLLSASVLIGTLTQDLAGLHPPSDQTGCAAAYQYVSRSPSSRVLSENLGPLLLAGKPILVSDPFAYDQLLKRGLWPDRQVEERLANRYFDLIVMSYDPSQIASSQSRDKVRTNAWLAPLATVIGKNYRVVGHFDCRDARVMLEPISSNPPR